LARSVIRQKNWEGESAPPGTGIAYRLRGNAGYSVRITIADAVTGDTFRTLRGLGTAGLHRVQWILRGDPPPRQQGQGGGGGFGGGQQGRLAELGVYRATLTVGGPDYTRTGFVEDDRWM